MPYILYKSNGQQLTVVQDGSIDSASTSLTFVGRNYAGYGQILDQNMAKLLENFANVSSPAKPMTGQLWYDTSTKNLKVYNGARYRSIQKFDSGNSAPTDSVKGDLWFNDADQKLYLFNGSNYVVIGPQNSTFSGVQLNPIVAYDNSTLTGRAYNLLQFNIANPQGIVDWPAIVTYDKFTPNITDNLIKQGFPNVRAGITLKSANTLGVSGDGVDGYLLWGTAASALKLWDGTRIYNPGDFLLESTYTSDLNSGLQISNDAGITINGIISLSANTSNSEGILSTTSRGNKITIALHNNSTNSTATVVQFNQNNILPDPLSRWDVNIGTPSNQFGAVYANTVTSNLVAATTVTGATISSPNFIGIFNGTFAGDLSTSGSVEANTLTVKTLIARTSIYTTGSITVASNLGVITPFLRAGSTDASPGKISGNWSLQGGSTLQATYSDLAERYHADAVYEPGTVLVIGGINEVTTTEIIGDPAVAGVVSTNPAYMMNSEAGTDETHPYLALKGRVPCKVVGKINKGDLLITSEHAGYAQAYGIGAGDHSSVIGKALEANSEGFGIIEIKV